LRKRVPEANISRDEGSLTLALEDWTARLYLDEEASVAEEAQEFPSVFPQNPRASEIARCHRRIDIWCPLDDPNMDHFNDFLFILEVLWKFRGLILIDPGSGELI
jgi:hypothetical protein